MSSLAMSLLIGIGLILNLVFVLVIYVVARRNLIFPSFTSRMFTQNRPSFTAELVGIFRAIATSQGYCSDEFAYEFLDFDAKLFVRFFLGCRSYFGLKYRHGGSGGIITRTRIFDDFVLKSECTQFVILGAGFDARPYRLQFPNKNIHIFEVDAPATQKLKQEKVQQVFMNNRKLFQNSIYENGRVTYVTCNFTSESFMEKLIEKGFNPNNNKTVFLLEGVASYLTWEELKQTLLLITKNCSSGTLFGINVLDNIEYQTKSKFSHFLSGIGEKWKFAMKKEDTCEGLFVPLGFTILKAVDFKDALKDVPGIEKEELKPFPGKVILMQVT